jgi:hypothetical protein
MNWNRLRAAGATFAWVGMMLCLSSCGSATLKNSDAGMGGASGSGGSKSAGGAGGTSSIGTGGTSTGGSSGTSGGGGGTHAAGGRGGNSDGGVSPDGPNLATNGTPCSAGGTCKSGICVDGVCCVQACGGQCESCKETASPGICVVVSGTPRSGRAACGGTLPCQASCDGTNGAACTFPGNSVQCVAASCAGGNAKSATACNGAGTCTTPTTAACSSNQCADGTKCSGGCSASLPCGTSQYCDTTGACLPLKAAGAQCKSSSECSSTYCVDNVCCGGACNGQCQGCNEGTPGTCVTVKGAPRGIRQACTGNDVTCGGTCDGTSATQCAYPGPSAVCGQPGCSGNTAISPALCDSHGGCTTPTTTSCGAGTYCNASAGSCANQVATGGTCQGDNQCTGGHCCGGTCANITTDNSNCGACGTVCVSGKQTCSGGNCLNQNGQPCSTSSPCLTGVCNVYYVDADGDGFGTSATAGFCNVSTPPAGYSTMTGDCCDSNSSVNPFDINGSYLPATPYPCGTMVSPWDYNCDGKVEVTGPAGGGDGLVTDVTCGSPPSCTASPVDFPASVCGQQLQACSCSYNGSLCVHSCSQPPDSFYCY